jgi:hypothetical protein
MQQVITQNRLLGVCCFGRLWLPPEDGTPTLRCGSKGCRATIARVSARPQPIGETDVAAVGALLAEPARAKVLLALGDGRSLAASVLAAEAGVAASTASHHLARLVDAGPLTVVRAMPRMSGSTNDMLT